ncbi:hypothetical protein K1T71_008565 [Dendrolimus kikuchii]|uniref:Uncharacterized protein n=1 Tax=Dendrolimus kikuchii TaxID=765133 RepID=A0ACC1CV08_9NEOP|nr:hypothetical protein K1T71_008565 [Dendrolimus kikuchii]
MKWLIITLVAIPCYSYRILCLLPYPGKSHNMVFEPLLEELTTRGHQLTVVTFFPASPQPNRRDVSLEGLAPLNVEIVNLQDAAATSFLGLDKYYESVPIVTQLALANLEICRRIINAEVFKEFLKAEGDYDIILVEHFNSDCMLGIVYSYGLPSVGLSSSAVMPWTPLRVGAPDNPAYVPLMTLPLTEDMTFFERIVNTFFLFFFEIWFEMKIRGEEQRILEKALGRTLPRLSEVSKNASAVLVNTYYTLNGVRNIPPSVVEVGGLHLHNRSVQRLPEDLETWVNETNDGFIVFTFGSLIRSSTLPLSHLEAIIAVFKRLPQRIIWKWETEYVPNMPPNMLVKKWLPVFDLLHHPKCIAVITHGGLLTLTETVSAGVPALIIPILGDQFGNAAHAKRAGIAEVLRFGELDENTFYAAVQKVISPEMRDKAKAVSKLWKDRPMSPMETAIYHIERAVRQKGVDSSSHARKLNRFQLALLDIIAFSIIIMVALGYFVKIILRKLKRKEKQC